MSILCTFPGKFGDLLWALPTVRALARRTGEAIDLLVAAPFASICPLIAQQPYIGHCWAYNLWQVQDTAPMTPRIPGERLPGDVDYDQIFDQIFHLGYRRWPQRPLPFETLDCANSHTDAIKQVAPNEWALADEELHLEEPWIAVQDPAPPTEIAVGFTDEHFELKVGVTLTALEEQERPYLCLAPHDSRWRRERPGASYPLDTGSWVQMAGIIRNADVFLGDCSVLHVLAVAIGTPVVLMEPQPMRWQEIFYPLGKIGPQVTLVVGNDGQPTWDSRHVHETLDRVLQAPLLRRTR